MLQWISFMAAGFGLENATPHECVVGRRDLPLLHEDVTQTEAWMCEVDQWAVESQISDLDV